MVCIGASIGKTGYTDRDCTCNQQINALIPEGFLGRYLYYILSSERFKKKLIDEAGQTTLPIISKSKWENLTISVSSSLIEQRDIVKRLDALSSKLEILQQNYTRQIADCAEMRQAVLREAFEGRL
jgi:type I restriction enzyme S subunit